MASIKAKITKRLVDSLKPKPGEDLFVWDTELRRYGLRMKPSGAASYLILYRAATETSECTAFARVGTVTPDEAQEKGAQATRRGRRRWRPGAAARRRRAGR